MSSLAGVRTGNRDGAGEPVRLRILPDRHSINWLRRGLEKFRIEFHLPVQQGGLETRPRLSSYSTQVLEISRVLSPRQ